MLITAIIALSAVLLDWRLGEPVKWHPLVGFGKLADCVERRFNRYGVVSGRVCRWSGAFCVVILLLPFTLLAAAVSTWPYCEIPVSVLLLYLAIGHKSLHEHAAAVSRALRTKNDVQARRLAGRLVSRDADALHITTATTESVLENGNDSVFGALFWYGIAGAAGVVLYRLVNTLDAMWGYRSERYQDFGRAAARFDDALNLVPARLTALTYAALGKTRQSLSCWRTQAGAWDSPNAGPVMAAGAGALGIRIGGAAYYGGQRHNRPSLGVGEIPAPHHIEQSLQLVRRGVALWVGVLLLLGGFLHA
jgi:adenosylcobinamide-phosphate synthase